jgi:2'-5' RNA ligase
VGSVEREVVEGIAEQLARRAPAGFELEPGDVGTFKRGRLVRVVWLGLRTGAEAAGALAATVEEACRSAGLAPEERAFQAHLTLARARNRDGSELPPLPAVPRVGPWRATQLVLFSSHLSRSGATYEEIRTVVLAR